MSRPGQPPRQPQPQQQQQPPVSFKTIPGRNRTQKWNEAKTYNYDGDDWGGFDPYDEYGGSNDTEPEGNYPPPHPGIGRQQSFEAGSERRQFSAPAYPPPVDRRGSPAMSASSGHASDFDRRKMRDFTDPSPSALNAQQSQSSIIARKPSATSINSTSGQRSPDKPLPFIRPSDIYKRMAEEKEKERLSMESSRPSMESLQREGTPNSAQRPLSTVQERPSSVDAATLLTTQTSLNSAATPLPATQPLAQERHTSNPTPDEPVPPSNLPVVTNSQISAYPDASRTAEHPVPAHHVNDLRSIVQGAFTRTTPQSSVGTSRDGDVSRSNTDSTSAISPIMSRVASSAAPMQRELERDTTVFPIAEEPVATSSHSRTVSAETMMPNKHASIDETSQAAQRSFSPSLPSPGNSPARTPDIGTVGTSRLSGPMTAQVADSTPSQTLSTAQETEPEANTITGRPRRGTDYSLREADMAREASTVADVAEPNSQLGPTQQQMQSEFLADHPADFAPLQRDWSFDASDSPIGPGSAEVLSVPSMPAPERSNSFQPQLPGGWVSSATTPALEDRTPLRQDESSTSSSFFSAAAANPATPQPHPLATTSSARDDPDLSPVTPRAEQEPAATKALNAAKNAGAALGAAFMSTAGTGHQDRDFASSTSDSAPVQAAGHQRGPSGNVFYSHPPLHREISAAPSESNASFTSERPPTPPAKDSLANSSTLPGRGTDATPPALPTIDVRGPSHGSNISSPEDVRSSSSVESSPSDFESDRLRRDIVRSLDMSNDAAARTAHLADPAGAEQTTRAPQAGPSSTSRPGLLDQRFSWETQPEPTAGATDRSIATVGELPGDKSRQSYERPKTSDSLHVTNVPREELQSPLVAPLSPIEAHSQEESNLPAETLSVPQGNNIDRDQLSPSPASMGESTHIPSYYAALNDEAPNAHTSQSHSPAQPPSDAQASRPSTAAAAAADIAEQRQEQRAQRQSARIPPFREILALKSPPERIQAYHDTRNTFATMDTGLNDWLTNVFASHPEHEDLKSAQGLPVNESIFTDSARGHKYNPSLLKMMPRSSTNDGNDRKVSRNSDVPPALPPKDVTMEKMQAKGKDIMKSAGVLGGKAQAGAKGLFAKGKSRFARGDKVE